MSDISTKKFNPNEVGIENGNIFGFPFTKEESKVVIIPVVCDVTASFAKGTANAPKAILKASTQLDFFDPNLKKAWGCGVNMLPIDSKEVEENDRIGEIASSYIAKIEKGEPLLQDDLRALIKVNEHCAEIENKVQEKALELVNNQKMVVVLGGDHSSSLGLINALAKKHESFGILQIDAHADLRLAYEGFDYSHASIMHNALKNKSLKKIVQIGVRDICEEEEELIVNSKGRIKTFFDWDIKKSLYEGITWREICDEVIDELPEQVYISYDIDGLDPKLCPNTGTPVSGGFETEQINYLINRMTEKNKTIIGFDLCEVGNSDWDANVGARVLYKLCNMMVKSTLTT